MTALRRAQEAKAEAFDMMVNEGEHIDTLIDTSWSKIAPFWPLKNLIAANPIAGFEEMPFEEALKQATAYFQQPDMPEGMQRVNRETLKWLQAFFDQGQSTIKMPNRHQGLLKSVLALLRYDEEAHLNNRHSKLWLKGLPTQPKQIISECLQYLGIPSAQKEQFLVLMLTTLPGWAAYIQYRTHWADAQDAAHPHTVSQAEYLALRLVLTVLLWEDARTLLKWHDLAYDTADIEDALQDIVHKEQAYRQQLVRDIQQADAPQEQQPEAQLVFCIDVRSEPFRRALEAQGKFETFGFAGFFGVPVSVEDAVTGEAHASCPVLLKPVHHVVEQPHCSHDSCQQGQERLQIFKKIYQSLKYTFAAPFGLVETLGAASGAWMGLRSFTPELATSLRTGAARTLSPDYSVSPDISTIPFAQQVAYGAGALKTMGLTQNFSPVIVFCGHGSTTQNNAYATALNCGACGGRHGAPNARILADILNNKDIRNAVKEQGIIIPEQTVFLGAEHNTTTDKVEIFDYHAPEHAAAPISNLKEALKEAGKSNNAWRSEQMGAKTQNPEAETSLRAQDWAQTRPEWGLAKNAAFVIAPRALTENVNLQGRSFLHSYDWQQDRDGSALTAILTAPMVVTQWINAQYFFSTYDNVAFGGGSKVTQNIVGKIGTMQGNSSDLMHGLSLQSVNKTDAEAYHEAVRLNVYVKAPQRYINPIIKKHAILKKLFGNGWIYLICHDPETNQVSLLQRDFSWKILNQ